jgi:O-antigen/teichoic acid export membrane protein
MNAIENAAFLTVAKACGFAWLAVFCAVFGWMYEPHMAALVGAVMSLLLALVLRFSAWRSLRKRYDRTEMWHYIPKEDRPPAEIAQRVISQVLHDTFQRFARQAAIVGAAMLMVSLGLKAFGITELPNLLPPGSPYAQRPPSLSMAGPPPPAVAR